METLSDQETLEVFKGGEESRILSVNDGTEMRSVPNDRLDSCRCGEKLLVTKTRVVTSVCSVPLKGKYVLANQAYFQNHSPRLNEARLPVREGSMRSSSQGNELTGGEANKIFSLKKEKSILKENIRRKV